VRIYKAEVNGRRSLELHFKQLMAQIWKASVVGVTAVAQTLADEPVEPSTPIPLLIAPRIMEACTHQALKLVENARDREQVATSREGSWIGHG